MQCNIDEMQGEVESGVFGGDRQLREQQELERALIVIGRGRCFLCFAVTRKVQGGRQEGGRIV